MREVVWLAEILWVSWFFCSVSSGLDPGEQAKVTTALETAQFVLNSINEDYTAQVKAIKELQKVSAQTKSAKLLERQTKLAKIVSKVDKALKAVQAASAIASFVFTFFMPSELDVITDLINKRFNEINNKLDRLDEKLDEMEKSIKVNTAFNTFLSAWIKWEYKSRNGAKKLAGIRKLMGTKIRRIDQVKLAEEYVKYYENNNLDGNLLNLYRMAALPNAITQRNIFDLFIAQFGCDITKLSELMILVKNIMTSAAQQKMTYYYFKGYQSRAKNSFKDIQSYFFKIRRAFDDRVWHCRRNSLNHAKTDANKILKNMRGSAQESIVQAIFNELKVKYPWYTWAVAAVKNDSPRIRGLEFRGNTYFRLEDRSDPKKVKAYFVVHEDTKSSASCIDITQAKTLLVFKKCDGCNSDYIYAADNILSKKRCGSSTLERVANIKQQCSTCRHCTYCTKYVKTEVRSWAFIASAVNTINDICQSDSCSSHGQCRQIPFTETHRCICETNYEGESCEKRLDFDETIETLIAELRKTFKVVNYVPTTVDVFFSIRSLSKKLNMVLQKIKTSFAHTNNIIKHSQIIYNVEDIADLYAKLQKNEMTFDQFGRKIDKYLQTVSTYKLQNRLKKMILGQGTLDTPGNDVYNSYKREYLSHNGGGCSAKYNEDIKSFRNSLAYLDQALGEALLLHQKWLLETKGKTENLRKKYKKEAEYIQNIFKGRQQKYNQYWKRYSCGPVSVDGTSVSCKDELTFEGMTVTLRCDKQRRSTPSQITCKRIGNIFKWDSQPKCKYRWGNFGAWGRCSKTCGGGVKFRYRRCLGTSNVNNCRRDQGGSNYQTAKCETQDCCSAQYGKFKCSNGRCIQKRFLCDGDNDCRNNDDESRSRCPNFIRSGDLIALRSKARRNQWLGCYCTVNCGVDRCKLRGCPGSQMTGSDWRSCSSETFNLYLTHYRPGEPVRYGDSIALYYGAGHWLSCWGSGGVCPTRSCPGYGRWDSRDTKYCRGERFWIYSPEREGRCSSDTRLGCRGKPIQKGDNVFIQYSIKRSRIGYWLSQDNKDIRTRTCPGIYITKKDRRCRSESWNIFAR
ncbi:SE-cephalotoxin-like [Montipora foliosa]|uniref:SE-cephalotoxin-like n=1 Tax=Montipora foliosa TaxID=591990 RepID=UPI0035F1D693